MRDLHYYLENPFDDPGISMTQLVNFTTDHVQRMSANVNGWIVPRITVTTNALTPVQNTFADDESKLALRKGKKQAKNAFRDTLPKAIGKIAVTVESKFGEGSPEFTQCFGHGRSIFSSCADDLLGPELISLVSGLTALQATLGAQVVTDATALLTGWNAVYTPSETATGTKTSSVAAKNAARQTLQLELFRTLLTIALNNPEQPANLDLYMQMSLLKDRPPTAATPAPAPALAPA
jgi:hypothetical protein